MKFAGIGCREGVPEDIQKLMKKISFELTKKGMILRSGGARGCDSYFESGVFDNRKEIFYSKDATSESIVLAKKYHPNTKNMSSYILGLFGRNIMIISGLNLNEHVDFVIAYTRDGKDSGGTGHSLRYARSLNIPIFNLFFKEDLEKLKKFINKK